MAQRTTITQDQLRALSTLSRAAGLDGFFLAGGTAVAHHLRHRVSRDLDLFSRSDHADLDDIRRRLVATVSDLEVVEMTDATLRVRIAGLPVDLVQYPYALLEAPGPGPGGMAVAGLLDLATMKLSAISRRGIRRDFWDLFEITTRGGVPLQAAAEAYVRAFGVKESDLYHVLRALTYFDDADAEVVFPVGLGEPLWTAIQQHFRTEAPRVLVGLDDP